MRFPLMLLLACMSLAGQTEKFSFGLTGGVPFGRMTSSLPFGPDESRRYALGITFSTFFTEHISVNVNPTYRRTGVRYGYVPNSPPLITDPAAEQVVENSGNVRGHSLQLPVIGNYTFGRASRSWRPFVGAGFAFQTSWEAIQNRVVLSNGSTTRTVEGKYDDRTSVDAGAVFTSGVDFKRGRFHYVPEFRFTRWGDQNFSHRRSQAEALFSVWF